ncbi:hypothetical protein HN682_01330 [Candidatus Peregrinibacteria bacterium]|jgi:hypothetical protein|nr:hypothetical protein [Candidatus Scalindua sp.]MBT7349910.1 hypothetical protein [candidate division WWE3 bacterium]MBT7928547.1 hypothetical protein [Candidatus Peregrinibacteria bacterium]
MAAGDISYYAGSLVERIVIAEALVALSDANVMLPLVTSKGFDAANTISFPKWNLGTNKITASDVSQSDPGTDAAAVLIDSEKKTLTPARYNFYIPLFDDSTDSSEEGDINVTLGRLGANAMGAKIDNLICAKFDSFSASNDVGTSSVAISVDNFFEAIALLKTAGAMGTYRGVFDPRQIWGAYGLSNDLITSQQFGGTPDKSNEMLTTGFIGSIAGIPIYTSRETTTATTATKAGIFGDGALAFGYVNPLIRFEPEREAKKQRTDYVFSANMATDTYQSTYGCQVWTKTSAA